MKKISVSLLLLFVVSAIQATVVRFETNLGNIDIEMYSDEAPNTVNNFLNYVTRGDYDGTVIHRSTELENDGLQIIQGGGYTYSGNGSFSTVATDPPINLEAGVSNSIGTIAMARTNEPNSATNQYFINVLSNSVLDAGGGSDGYAVFGEIIDGMDVVNLISSLQKVDFRSSNLSFLTQFPTYLFTGETTTNASVDNFVLSPSDMTTENVVVIERAYVLSEAFNINVGLSGAWYNPITDGQGIYLEVLPSLNTMIVAWFTYDTTLPDSGVPSTVGSASNRWMTASGNFTGDTFVGTVYKTDNGQFDAATTVTVEDVGALSIQFNDCATAEMTYVLEDSELSNIVQIQRISSANVAFCEELANQNGQPAVVVE